METTRPPEPRREDDAPPRVVVSAPRRRGRVREALRCPYCHDQVDRSDVLACARGGCGALYHRECWDECARFDGCAALGCGSRESREVTALGYLLRVVRLVVAALLFPRRVARALRANADASAVSLFRQALRLTRLVLPRDLARGELGSARGWYLFLVAFIVTSAAVFATSVPGSWLARVDPDLRPLLVALVGIGVGVFGVPLALALLATLAFVALRALARAFVDELGAFARGEAPAVRAPRVDPKKDVT